MREFSSSSTKAYEEQRASSSHLHFVLLSASGKLEILSQEQRVRRSIRNKDKEMRGHKSTMLVLVRREKVWRFARLRKF